MKELPPLPDNFAIPMKEPEHIRKIQNESPFHYPTSNWKEKDWRQYLWGYYRLIEMVDNEIGSIIDVIEKRTDETVIIFVSDHGEGVASHHWNQKQILYEQSVKVPTILSYWGKNIKKGTSSELVSMSLDIPVTILDIANGHTPSEMSGESLYPILKNPGNKLQRKYSFAETRFAKGPKELGLHGRMVVSERFKYCLYDRGTIREQLFDLRDDPGEQKNLIDNKKYITVLYKMRKELKSWAKKTLDKDFDYNFINK